MEKEKFDPKDEQYKEVADLPPENQEEFMDVKGGGFVTRDAILNPERAEEIARMYESARERFLKKEKGQVIDWKELDAVSLAIDYYGLSNYSSLDLLSRRAIMVRMGGGGIPTGFSIERSVTSSEFLDFVRDMNRSPEYFNVCGFSSAVTVTALNELIKKSGGERLTIMSDPKDQRIKDLVGEVHSDGNAIIFSRCNKQH